MKKVFFTLIFLLGFVNLVNADENIKRYEEECLSLIEKPSVSVSSSYGKLRYNYSKDSSFLRKETEKKFAERGLEYPKEFEPMGLTQIQEGFEVKMNVGTVSVSHGKQCLYPENIDIFWGYYLPVIYIAKELAEGTCLYDLTLRHEKVHMRIYIEGLDYYLPKLKVVADSLFDKKGVKIIDKNQDLESSAKEFNEGYVRYVENIVKEWHKEIEAEQMELDSINNYILEAKICAGIDNFSED
ncbi:MAG: hypothetical protein IKW39_02930 [Alphaproteobacteria bacterium]|nr:hypothetical protein [Alphaproteobacteria bacterium]